jgi:hypothetical protein
MRTQSDLVLGLHHRRLPLTVTTNGGVSRIDEERP